MIMIIISSPPYATGSDSVPMATAGCARPGILAWGTAIPLPMAVGPSSSLFLIRESASSLFTAPLRSIREENNEKISFPRISSSTLKLSLSFMAGILSD